MTVIIKRTDEDCFDSGLYAKILYPTAKKALDLYSDKVKKGSKKTFKCEVDGYKVGLIDNSVINEDLFPLMFPDLKDAEQQINIEIEIKGRIYVGAIFYLIKGEWVNDM